jgi:hypothetical protein
MFSACQRQPTFELLLTKTIDFPSGSGLSSTTTPFTFLATMPLPYCCSIPDTETVGRKAYWKNDTSIIAKDEKPDIESALMITINNKPVLIGVGSMSGEKRWGNYTFELGSDSLHQAQFFKNGTNFSGIEEINIEGSTAYSNAILLGNRANLSTKKNHLLLWSGKEDVLVKELALATGNHVAGLSGLHYVAEKDLLLFTASEEATTSAYEDGVIGNSYLGWINNFSEAWKSAEIVPTKVLKLPAFDPAFQHQKIESVCLESLQGRRYLLHLAADNDDGKTVLFKVALTL